MTEYAPHSKDTNPLLHVKFKHFEQRLRCLMSHNCCDAGLRFIQSHPRLAASYDMPEALHQDLFTKFPPSKHFNSSFVYLWFFFLKNFLFPFFFFFGPTSYEIYTYITRVDHDYTYVNQYSCLNGLQ